MASSDKKYSLKREIIAISCISLAIFIGCCLISYNPSDPSLNTAYSSGIREVNNWMGIVGSHVADALFQFIGLSAFMIPIALIWPSLKLFFPNMRYFKLLSCLFFIISLSGIFSLVWVEPKIGIASFSYELSGGGVVGSKLTELSLKYLNRLGSYTLFFLMGVVSFILFTDISILKLARGCGRFLSWLINSVMFLSSMVLKLTGKLKKLYHVAIKIVRAAKELFARWKMKKMLKDRESSLASQALSSVGKSEKKVSKRTTAKKQKSKEGKESTESFTEYQVPPLSLLDSPSQKATKADKEALKANSKVLESKLADFGVQGKVVEVNPGPVITRYEFEPASGVRISKILGLADDLALALRAIGVRILAPVPGKAVVGIEIPNAVRETVCFKEIVGREEFLNAKSKLTIALGKDIAGKPIITDLSKMPHLLIAGSTGSGKSVLINAMICSIIYKAAPSEVKMLLIDPKRLELSFYEDIPHLLNPVVTDPKKASLALQWTVSEMERRYQKLAGKGVRDIDSYNRKVETELKNAKGGDKEEDEEILIDEKLPYILVVIDELADLMMVSSREVEISIARLAQMARAAGIHLLVATQRPSVDVLTGTIKVNFSARISFQVSSKTDSRTILDTMGAERLLGRGDMLFLPPETSKLLRVHGTYLSESEIRRVTDFLKKQGSPDYNQNILETREEEVIDRDNDYDERYDDAVALVAQTRMASISMVQRRLRVGYNRAARIIEKMEREGVVGPSDGVKPREVLIKRL
jgi:S-DNA-T family DNA segregation ATPase FtsK/SpoIIIE